MIDAFVRMRDEDWFGILRLARLVPNATHSHTHGLIAEITKKFYLPIKTFDTKSKAIAWLLYDYE